MENTANNSTLTCPDCGFQKIEEMPVDSCIFFWNCESCNTLHKPLSGDCCVFCSYGSVKCPPKTAAQSFC